MTRSRLSIRCGELTHLITTEPPLETEPASGWWVRLDDVWLRLRARREGEELTPEVERELCTLVRAIFRSRAEERMLRRD